MEDRCKTAWYAMKVFLGCSDRLELLLKQEKVEYWLPKREVEHHCKGKKVVVERPVMNILFFRATRPYAFYLRGRIGGSAVIYRNLDSALWSPLEIPSEEIERFKRAVALLSGHIRLWDDSGDTLRLGQRVRVSGGQFKGMEGYLKRIRGNKRLVVTIDGVCSIATAYIPKDYIEVIEEKAEKSVPRK